MPFPVCDFEGPDATKFLEKYIVNTMKNRPVGKGMHAICCNDEGKITDDGIIIKTGENSYRSFCPIILPDLYEMEKDNLDMTFTKRYGEIVVYQLCGPRSLEIVETALEKDMHHLGFMGYDETTMGNDIPVQILRAGMAGTLGYEVHCPTKYANAVYAKIIETGKAYGLVQLGRHSYRNAHIESGFTQENIHFWYANYHHDNDIIIGKRTDSAKPIG